MAKGYVGGRSRTLRQAKDTVEKALTYAYRDRRNRKRDFRKLWIARINAGSRAHGMPYNRFVEGLRKAGIDLDRKVLADLAVTETEDFGAIVERSKAALQ
jgi:large subunit ribosomal protein L20